MKEIEFTHLWVDDFGWEDTIFLPEDFKKVEYFGTNEKEYYIVFCGIQDNNKIRILKGYYK